MKKNRRFSSLLNLALTIVAYVVIKLVLGAMGGNRAVTNLLTQVCYNIIMVASLNLVAGVLGELTLGPCGLYGRGRIRLRHFYIAHSSEPALDVPDGADCRRPCCGAFRVSGRRAGASPAGRLSGDYHAGLWRNYPCADQHRFRPLDGRRQEDVRHRAVYEF